MKIPDWIVMIIFDHEGKEKTFFYSVGNAEEGLPELLVIGNLPPHVGNLLINVLVDKMRRSGQKFDEGLMHIGWSFPMKIRNASKVARQKYTCVASQEYGSENYEVQQILICDENGIFPDEDGVNEKYKVEMV